jgi:ribosomal-protein-alanine N-acetyltransferase
MESNIILNTERLLLEPLKLKHATEKYASWLNDPEVYKYLESRGGQTIVSINEFINKQITNKVYIWAIIDKALDVHIGNIKIDPINNTHKYGEYGILIGDKDYWGKGLMLTSIKAILKFADYILGIVRVQATVITTNDRSIKLLERCGFKKEGCLKKYELVEGELKDYYMYARVN